MAVITRGKRQDLLIDTVNALVKKGVPAVGLIVGNTVSADDEAYKRFLEEKIADEDTGENVFFLGRRADVPNLLSLADYVFVPSEEGLSLSAMEAMCAKVEVIASKSGGAYELLTKAGSGILYEKDATPDEIADVIMHSKKSETRLSNGYAFCSQQTENSYKEKIVSVLAGKGD